MGCLSMVKIVKKISNNKNHYGTGNPANYITIHETDNWSYGANAEMHSRYINNGSTSTWHYSVDDTQAIQSFEHTIRAWHGGDGKGKGNMESIAIEICVNRDGNYNKSVQNAIELVRVIMKQENIPASHVVQHNHWSGKNCPRALRHGRNGITWKDFKNAIQDELQVIQTDSITDLVARTLSGEFGNGDSRKRNLGKHYNEVQKRINEKLSVNKKSVDVDDLVKRTLAGEFGNGEARKQALGTNYKVVQDVINLKHTKPSVNVNNLLERTLRGEFGNGEERKKRLGKYYNQVQKEINKRYS